MRMGGSVNIFNNLERHCDVPALPGPGQEHGGQGQRGAGCLRAVPRCTDDKAGAPPAGNREPEKGGADPVRLQAGQGSRDH